jgi:cytochrome c
MTQLRQQICNVTTANAKRSDGLLAALVAIGCLIFTTVPALADQALATSKNCMSCHAVDRKLVGPAYKDVAAKYKGDKAAADRLATKVMKGGGGVWGAVPMPSNPQVSEAEAKNIVAWILSL